jgi:hypothetical protein
MFVTVKFGLIFEHPVSWPHGMIFLVRIHTDRFNGSEHNSVGYRGLESLHTIQKVRRQHSYAEANPCFATNAFLTMRRLLPYSPWTATHSPMSRVKKFVLTTYRDHEQWLFTYFNVFFGFGSSGELGTAKVYTLKSGPRFHSCSLSLLTAPA